MITISDPVKRNLLSLGLSSREIEILAFLAEGKSNKTIGKCLEISSRTVSKHLEHIYSKLRVTSRTCAVAVLFELTQTVSPTETAFLQTQLVNTNNKRVLLVDDDLSARRAIRALLEYQGYVCAEAKDAAMALKWVETQQADLIITDCHMPGISGVSFLKLVKARFLESKNSIPPIIVLSGNLTEPTKNHLRQIGVYAMVEKPPHFDSFLSIVAQSMMERTSRQHST